MNYKIEYDDINNKIVADEPTDEKCWEYGFVRSGKSSGHGIIARKRETCVKRMLKYIERDTRQLRKELRKKEDILEKMTDMLGDE